MSNRSGRPASAPPSAEPQDHARQVAGPDPLGRPVAVLRARRMATGVEPPTQIGTDACTGRGATAAEPSSPGAVGQGRVLVVERGPQGQQRRVDVGAPAGEVDAQQGELALDVPGARPARPGRRTGGQGW